MRAITFIAGLMLIAASIYTTFVVLDHGVNFVPEYIGNIVAMNWAGQFQIDFSCYLILSALWIGWRHRFSGAGIALSMMGLVGGILFFSAYLVVISVIEKGDVASLVLGSQRGGGTVSSASATS